MPKRLLYSKRKKLAKQSLINKWLEKNVHLSTKCAFCYDTVKQGTTYLNCAECIIDKRLCNVDITPYHLYNYILNEYRFPNGKNFKQSIEYKLMVNCLLDTSRTGKISLRNGKKLDKYLDDKLNECIVGA